MVACPCETAGVLRVENALVQPTGHRMAKAPPDAFLSYTRFDDDDSEISTFRERLSNAVRKLSGEPFDIFQDIDGIGVGEPWSDKLEQILDQARFFIPIITPNYFKSEACRRELHKFLDAEKKAGRNDLIIPIYYIQTDVLEDKVQREGDDLAKVLHGRQVLRLARTATFLIRNAQG